VVAREMHPVLSHKKLRGLQRKKWPRQAVAKVHDHVDIATGEVANHRLKRGQVSMSI
jgi:hypothetical protein